MKKMVIPMGALLLAGSLAWGGYEHHQSNEQGEKVKQYESYLSSTLTNDTVKLFGITNSVSVYLDNFIKNKQLEPDERSVMIGQLHELMTVAQTTEELAVTTKLFENETPAYLTASAVYEIGTYLSSLDPSKELTENEMKNLKTIQSFIKEWNKVVNKHLSELDTQEGFDAFFEKHETSMINESIWIDTMNQLDKETARLLKEKKASTVGELLSE